MTSGKPWYKKILSRWNLALILFLAIYAAFLILDLDYMSIQWDETPHLNGGLLLSRGNLKCYFQERFFYPPLFDLVTSLYFKVLGINVLSGRLVSVTFGILSVFCVFGFASKTYGVKRALISSVFLALMPGFIFVSRMALIETMLIFFFSSSLLLFVCGMTQNFKILPISGVLLGLGILAKYQAFLGGVIMLISLFLIWKGDILDKLGKYLLVLATSALTVLPWIMVSFQKYAAGTLGEWFYVLNLGSPERLLYSSRFPLPLFYLIEMVYPYSDIHPISLFIYLLSLLGLGLWLWRRNPNDKFCLIWFCVIYFFFTAIPNKHWRYVVPIFPVLSLSAADFTLTIWNKTNDFFKGKKITKTLSLILILLVGLSLAYSAWNAYYWIQKDHFQVPAEEATKYVMRQSEANRPVVVLCASNSFHAEMINFYLRKYHESPREVYQYPTLPIDAYPLSFDINELIQICEKSNVQFLLLYQYGNVPFHSSKITFHEIYEKMYHTQRFMLETEFGDSPRKVFIISFTS